MKIRFCQKPIKALTSKEHRKLWDLTFRTYESLMREQLEDKETSKAIALMAIATECPYKNTIVGWACIVPNKSISVYFFVRPDLRRNGIGSKLLKKVLKQHDRFYVYESSYSRKFYKKKFGIDLKDKYRKRIDVTCAETA